ncbi:DUF2939 domain-containing protein [Thiocystis violacea]|uniref:DUF2939 domain-containing protein n=1 Tax=Thiocystis violacea TaxID=13725 RepID=UPI0019070AEE|nr:DUF2939 domain-containing protein [Thiocystis violacea]MBK1721211.1 hypothetical protein [Thiocystis violacea]
MRLFRFRVRDHEMALVGRAWRRTRTPVLRASVVLLVTLLLYGVWPYATLWQLHLAVMHEDQAALAVLVDLDAVREEIARRLNKERESLIGELSDPFIEWLETGLRQSGPGVLQSQVTLDWVRDQLIAATAPGFGFLSALSYCFFDSVRGFVVRMDRGDGTPVTLRLHLDGRGWRVSAVYY